MKRILASLLVGTVAYSGGQQTAAACGGLFCNSPPPDPFAPLPIAQTGENIVFGVGKDPTTGAQTVEAHIQIFYSGPADKFSWIVPVDAAPTVGVGSDRLFTAVAGLTRPIFNVEVIREGTCKVDPPVQNSPSAAGAGGSAGIADGGADGGGVQVLSMGAVGPYETAVIHSTDRSSAALIKWLKDNMYYVGPDAVSIIDQYVQENKYFVAVRLLNGKDVQAIQPVVLNFTGGEPCVPLRLTAIAAQNDLQINLWVLGQSRAVPKNYFEIKLNEAKLDWPSGGSNYTKLVREAADEAGGNAFIAEYAGTARVLDRAVWQDGRIDLARLRLQTIPPAYLRELVTQGLNGTASLLSLLRIYIPEPQALKDLGVTEAQFYANNQLYWTQFQSAFAPFDPVKLTDEIDTAIVTPLHKSQMLLDAHPYLTRLATFISPIEMTHDPVFIFNDELPALSNIHTAKARVQCGEQQYRYCDAPALWELPGGQVVWQQRFCSGWSSPSGDLLMSPSLDVAYQRAEGGEGTRVADNGALIAASVLKHNQGVAKALALPPSALRPDGTPATPLSGGGGTGGCGCRIPGGPLAPSAAVVLLLALAALRRRRPRSR